jgi:hypothetical protein
MEQIAFIREVYILEVRRNEIKLSALLSNSAIVLTRSFGWHSKRARRQPSDTQTGACGCRSVPGNPIGGASKESESVWKYVRGGERPAVEFILTLGDGRYGDEILMAKDLTQDAG